MINHGFSAIFQHTLYWFSQQWPTQTAVSRLTWHWIGQLHYKELEGSIFCKCDFPKPNVHQCTFLFCSYAVVLSRDEFYATQNTDVLHRKLFSREFWVTLSLWSPQPAVSLCMRVLVIVWRPVLMDSLVMEISPLSLEPVIHVSEQRKGF